MSSPLFSVRPSGIHGLGLFANQFIPAGTELGRLEGEPTTQDGPHVLWLDESRGFRVLNDLRYINHDDEPNAAYYDDLTVAAIADILQGQEITHDYDGDEAEDGDEGWDPEPAQGEALTHSPGIEAPLAPELVAAPPRTDTAGAIV